MFYIQDLKFSKTLTVHEAILTASKNTTGEIKIGAGVFAFVTKGGTALVFEDQVLKEFLLNGFFTLIVGIDDITNTNTLIKLRELKDMHRDNLEIKVFYHNDTSSLFHPKFIWFKGDEKIKLITGSGNLTEKGLRRNREAFTINEFENEKLKEFEEYWESWLEENNNNLKELDDEDVIAKAAINATRFFRTPGVESDFDESIEQSTKSHTGGETLDNEDYLNGIDDGLTNDLVTIEPEDYGAWSIQDDLEALVAEIPNSGSRWKQANFSKSVFEGFFGAIAGSSDERRILLRDISLTGLLEEIEVRTTVSVISQNYRIELKAASGLDYPEGDNRPIGIFIKVATRSFVYSLYMPEDRMYNEVLDYLNNSQEKQTNRMRRFITNVDDLRLNCPNLNLWLI